MTTSEGLVFVGLCFIPAILTVAMFISKERLLGFPCGIFFALLGGYSYTLSVSAWDFFGIMGFACLLGMVTFAIYSSFALKEKLDSFADEQMKRGDGSFIDEGREEPVGDESGEPKPRLSKATRGVRARAEARRNKGNREY